MKWETLSYRDTSRPKLNILNAQKRLHQNVHNEQIWNGNHGDKKWRHACSKAGILLHTVNMHKRVVACFQNKFDIFV